MNDEDVEIWGEEKANLEYKKDRFSEMLREETGCVDARGVSWHFVAIPLIQKAEDKARADMIEKFDRLINSVVNIVQNKGDKYEKAIKIREDYRQFKDFYFKDIDALLPPKKKTLTQELDEADVFDKNTTQKEPSK